MATVTGPASSPPAAASNPVLRSFRNLAAVAWLALRRLSAQRGLALATTLGLLVAVAVTMSIPLYADATHFRLLRENLLGRETAEQLPGGQTPLVFLHSFSGALHENPQWEDLRAVDDYLVNQFPSDLRLRALSWFRLYTTDSFKLYPPLEEGDTATQYLLSYVRFSMLDPIEPHLRLVNGDWPAAQPGVPAGAASPVTVDVLMNADLALELGIAPGDTFFARRDVDEETLEITVHVSGTYLPADPGLMMWAANANGLLIVPEAAFAAQIAPLILDDSRSVFWYMSLDGSGLLAGKAEALISRAEAAGAHLASLLPGTKLEQAPLDELARYQEAAPELTLLLYAFSIPIVGLALAFIGLVTGMFVAQHQNEIAVLRSRGASRLEIASMTLVEGLLFGTLALILGIPAGQGLASLIGRSRSFLDFGSAPLPRVMLTPETLGFGAAAVIFVLLVQILLPAYLAAQRTVVTYKQERARTVQAPWWQRAWLDLLAFIPAGYAIFQLERQGSIAAQAETAVTMANETALALDPFQNPLLLLAPALTLLALTMFLLRFLPGLIAALAWGARRTNSVGFLMAARFLSRSPAAYNTPLALLVITLSLSTFTASLATTMDEHLQRQVYYQVGADLNLTEQGIIPPPSTEPGSSINGQADIPASQSYLFDPVAEHLRLPGVLGATPVAVHKASFSDQAGLGAAAVFMGVDRLTFPQTAFWSRDFAPMSLGELMNRLGSLPEAVLVSQDLLDARSLAVGDSLQINVQTPDGAMPMQFVIVGVIDLFPTWYPEQGGLVVGNLDTFYRRIEGELPHQVWLRTSPGLDNTHLVAAVRGFTALLDDGWWPGAPPVVVDGLNTFVSEWQIAPQIIEDEQVRPERQGLFGLLSVGFLASAVLTVLGFLLYAIFSFRRRFVELGMMRAVGLSEGQLSSFLAAELGFLLGTGVLAGTTFGVAASLVFIPYLQVGVEMAQRFPPFVVQISWTAVLEMYILFGLLFVAALGILVNLLMRMKIFQAIKLGETL